MRIYASTMLASSVQTTRTSVFTCAVANIWARDTPAKARNDRIAAKMFTELGVDTFYLEYDAPRAGGSESLNFLPKSKNVVLGVVTSKFPHLV